MTKNANTTTTKLIVSLTSKVLSPELKKAEKDIKEAQLSFVKKGAALVLIDTDKLYLERGFQSFDQYTTTMWDIKRNYAYKIMRAFQIYTLLKGKFKPSELPTAETHCRPLATIKDDADIIKVWGDVIKMGRPTAKNVTDMMNLHTGKGKASDTPNPEPETNANNANTSSDSGSNNASDNDSGNVSDLEKIKILEARIIQLENELQIAQKAGSTKATKMGKKMINAGFSVLIKDADDTQKKQLLSTKKALLG